MARGVQMGPGGKQRQGKHTGTKHEAQGRAGNGCKRPDWKLYLQIDCN
jgi:hypothetical protein